MVSLSAKDLQDRYGEMLQELPYCNAASEYYLHKALTSRRPPLRITLAVVKQWWKKYKVLGGEQSVRNAQELDDQYGDIVRELAAESGTPFTLARALRERAEPLYVPDGILRQWFQKFQGDLKSVYSAGHLEGFYGHRIRADAPQEDVTAITLRAWLRSELSVSVSVKVCETWLTKDWSSSGGLYTAEVVEETLGERLRLNQYQMEFASDESAQHLSEVLSESQPPHRVSATILRQWYTKYHPDSGPLRYDTAEQLEQSLGDHLRAVYGGFRYKVLRSVPPVLVS
jgi:hypothetical protein